MSIKDLKTVKFIKRKLGFKELPELQKELAEKIKSNITECRVRGAKILTLVRKGDHFFDDVSDDIWEIPDTMPEYTPTLAILPMQLLAYYTSVQRGNDVDMPRNLAKSVTVE